MLAFNKLLFDFSIPATGTWYSPCTFDELLGSADAVFLMVHTMTASGTAPTITCRLEHSADGRKWSQVNVTAEINAASLTSDTAVESTSPVSLVQVVPYLRFVRVKMTIGGTSPAGRLRVYATGRVSGAARAAPQSLQPSAWAPT